MPMSFLLLKFKTVCCQNFYGGRALALKRGGNDSDGVAGRWGGAFSEPVFHKQTAFIYLFYLLKKIFFKFI